MDIISIVQLVLKVTSGLVDYFNKKQLIDLGEAKAINKHLKKAQDEVQKAIKIRRDSRRKLKSDGMPENYKYYRD